MSDSAILRTLQTATIHAVAASQIPTLPIAFVDVSFVPPVDQKYLEIVFIPNNPGNEFWGNERNYMGLYRLILHWPKNGAGAYKPMDVLHSIGAYFSKDRLLDGGLKVADNPSFTGSLVMPGEILYPLGFRYQRFN